MGTKIIIHVGPWKTGSSALQEFFHLNREILQKHGVHYPKGIVSHNSQHEIPNLITGSIQRFHWVPNCASIQLNELVKSYYDEMNLHQISTLLLSSEDFAIFESEHYSRLFQSLSIQDQITFEIIYFDFDPLKRLKSYINQYIRQGEYIDNISSDQIFRKISQIQTNFQNATQMCDAIIHRIDYEQLLNSNDIYEKTLGLILNKKNTGILDGWSIPPTGVNASMSSEQTDYLNDFNKLNLAGRSFDESCPVTYSEKFPMETKRFNAFTQILSAVAERDSAVAERDSAVAERDSAVAERDSAVAERDSAVAERDSAVAERDSAVAERDSAVAERDSAVAERDSAVAERDSAVAERDSAVAERDSAVAERDRFLKSKTWRLLSPYRRVRNLF